MRTIATAFVRRIAHASNMNAAPVPVTAGDRPMSPGHRPVEGGKLIQSAIRLPVHPVNWRKSLEYTALPAPEFPMPTGSRLA